MDRTVAKEFRNFESIIYDSLQKNTSKIVKRAKKQETERGIDLGILREPVREFEEDDVWNNWAGNISFKPNKIFNPRSLEDLKSYVKLAQKDGKKIRCASEGHSWSTLSVTDGYLVILNKLDKVRIEKRNNGYVAHAQAGAEISQIDKALENHDPPLTITSMTVLDNVRIGGVVATGCHGAKTDSRTIVDQVVGLKIVTSDGKLREFSDEINREEMEAARVNLGLLGIIYEVSIHVEPMYSLRMIDTHPEKTKFTSAYLRDLIKNSDGIEIFYWPFNSQSKETDKLWVKQWIKTNEPNTLDELQQTFHRIAQAATTEIANGLYQHVLASPEKTPFITNLAGKLKLVERNEVLDAPDSIHYQAGIDNIPCEDLEYAIKADENFDNVVTEVNYIIDRIYEYAKEDKYPINLVAELRILKSSSATLSNAYDEDPNAHYFFLEVLSIKDTPFYKEFTIELAQRWMKLYKAIPHWAKSWEYVPNIHQYVRERYGDRIRKFEKIRKKYDPNDMFFDNESLKRVFYGDK